MLLQESESGSSVIVLSAVLCNHSFTIRVADMLHHRQVMGDEEEAEALLLLQFFEQVDDVGLQADIQRGNRLVTNDEVRCGDQSARDGRALPLPAGNVVG